MARPIKQRKIISPYPHFESDLITSAGKKHGRDPVLLLTEEFEAIKLIDYEGLDHARASELMQVSRPTFTRIYKRARIKIAVSLIENRTIQYSQGNIYFSGSWYKCSECESVFNFTAKTGNITCPLCKSHNFLKQ